MLCYRKKCNLCYAIYQVTPNVLISLIYEGKSAPDFTLLCAAMICTAVNIFIAFSNGWCFTNSLFSLVSIFPVFLLACIRFVPLCLYCIPYCLLAYCLFAYPQNATAISAATLALFLIKAIFVSRLSPCV